MLTVNHSRLQARLDREDLARHGGKAPVTIAQLYHTGAQVKILQGCGYTTMREPREFQRANTDLYGEVYAVQGGTIYILLDSGLKVSTSDMAAKLI